MWNIPDLMLPVDDEPKNVIVSDYIINDIIVCKLKERIIVLHDNQNYDDKISLKVIGLKKGAWESIEYVVYIPDYELGKIKSSIVVSRVIAKDYSIEKRFIGDQMAFIRGSHVCSIAYKADGARCVNCSEWFDMAEPNHEDGKTFVCSACVLNPYR